MPWHLKTVSATPKGPVREELWRRGRSLKGPVRWSPNGPGSPASRQGSRRGWCRRPKQLRALPSSRQRTLPGRRAPAWLRRSLVHRHRPHRVHRPRRRPHLPHLPLPTICLTGRTRPPCRSLVCSWTSNRRQRWSGVARPLHRLGDRCGANVKRTGTTRTRFLPTWPMPASASLRQRSRRPTTPSPTTSSTPTTRLPGSLATR